MHKIITYKMPLKSIVVGIPFTWGSCSFWVIKVEGGCLYRLDDGRKVDVPQRDILLCGIVYANGIEIK